MSRWTMIIAMMCACGGRDWYVVTPKQIASVPIDSFYAIPMRASAGGRQPGSVREIQARCVDAAICETRVLLPEADRQFGEVHVIGKQPGSTSVVVDFQNPVYGDHEHRTIPVTVTPVPSRSAISVGAPIPDGAELVHAVAGVDVGRCTLDHGAWGSSVTGSDRTDVRIYVCSSYVDVENQRRFRSCADDELCSADDSYLLCTQMRDGTVAATAVLNLDKGKWTSKTIDGTLDAGVCTPR